MEKKIQPYHELIVWREAHAFTLLVYRLTDHFPTNERYGITSQLRRAAVSVETNIVEGRAKRSHLDFLRFLNISDGSLQECAVLIEISVDLSYFSEEQYTSLEAQRRKTGYLLNEFILSIRRNHSMS
jgi:four helix bundle protein